MGPAALATHAFGPGGGCHVAGRRRRVLCHSVRVRACSTLRGRQRAPPRPRNTRASLMESNVVRAVSEVHPTFRFRVRCADERARVGFCQCLLSGSARTHLISGRCDLTNLLYGLYQPLKTVRKSPWRLRGGTPLSFCSLPIHKTQRRTRPGGRSPPRTLPVGVAHRTPRDAAHLSRTCGAAGRGACDVRHAHDAPSKQEPS